MKWRGVTAAVVVIWLFKLEENELSLNVFKVANWPWNISTVEAKADWKRNKKLHYWPRGLPIQASILRINMHVSLGFRKEIKYPKLIFSINRVSIDDHIILVNSSQHKFDIFYRFEYLAMMLVNVLTGSKSSWRFNTFICLTCSFFLLLFSFQIREIWIFLYVTGFSERPRRMDENPVINPFDWNNL